jgi:hypothetical protein
MTVTVLSVWAIVAAVVVAAVIAIVWDFRR